MYKLKYCTVFNIMVMEAKKNQVSKWYNFGVEWVSGKVKDMILVKL